MTTIILPWPDKLLNPNSHVHWRSRQAAKVVARDTAKILTLETGQTLAPNTKLKMTLTMCPPDRRRRDADNVLASCKVAQDSICRALGVDDWQIKRVVLEWGDVVRGGQVIVRLEEMT